MFYNILYGIVERFFLVHGGKHISRTKLKPYVPLCGLFYLYILELTLFILKLLLAQHNSG